MEGKELFWIMGFILILGVLLGSGISKTYYKSEIEDIWSYCNERINHLESTHEHTIVYNITRNIIEYDVNEVLLNVGGSTRSMGVSNDMGSMMTSELLEDGSNNTLLSNTLVRTNMSNKTLNIWIDPQFMLIKGE